MLSWVIVVLALGGMGVALYPMAASWVSSYNQSRIIERSTAALADLSPAPERQRELAHEYNAALTSGVVLEAGGNVPVGTGELTGSGLRYADMLHAGDDGLMARIRVPGIDLDLPVYHGTSDAVLLAGAGHLEGSHLPVGGAGTRSVITAHRGLADATMFTNLDRVREGDTFTVEVLGEVLTYRVFEVQVIDPADTGSLRAEAGKDLMTLITCTPLGINSHRIVVTGERITPTPIADLKSAGAVPSVPGFPWWLVIGAAGTAVGCVYLLRRGFADAALRERAVTVGAATGGGSTAAPGHDANVTER